MGLLKKVTGGSKGLDSAFGLGPSVDESLGGLKGDAAKKANEEIARLTQEYADKAIALERKQFDKSYEQQKPFIQAGAAQLDPLARSATAKGYADELSQIMGGDVAQTRRGFVDDTGSMVGLRRDLSGVGDLRMNEAMGIADILNQRRQSLAGKGLSSSDYTAGLGQGSASNISNLLGGIGQAQSQSILNQAQARAQGIGNIGNLAGSAYDYFRGSNWGSGGGTSSNGGTGTSTGSFGGSYNMAGGAV
ncbi:MAG: hypothetical protein GY727_10795 [Gammaproteobacteria bacterium]|nr:hypothetical protein [Gammaproteobacteria bacterium]